LRQRGEETPSHPGGLSDTARKRLEEHRRLREKQRGTFDLYYGIPLLTQGHIPEGITAVQEQRSDVSRGLGDFQRRSNRDSDRGWVRRDYDKDQHNGRDWDSTPRSERSNSNRDAPSVRVPNVGWDSTPRRQEGEGSGWGGARNRAWDAPTPRVPRGGSPEDDGLLGVDVREWEEEQLRLDRDWYTGAEEGGVAGDEEHNPLAQYEDLSALKEAEIAKKQVVCC
jgi:pre-mRNA-splicing factor ATP-dependent RNA helicase DHX38/PRP16